MQEIGTMLRRGLCPYLFVLNNDGYEIERQSELSSPSSIADGSPRRDGSVQQYSDVRPPAAFAHAGWQGRQEGENRLVSC